MKLLRYILLLSAVVTLQTGWAQRSDYEPEFTVGVKGGTTLSRVSFTPTVTQALLLGYNISASLPRSTLLRPVGTRRSTPTPTPIHIRLIM